VFQARIFEERGLFSLEDIAHGIADKLERRHPHVFNKPHIPTNNLQKQWENIKREEKSQQGQRSSTLGYISSQLPACDINPGF